MKTSAKTKVEQKAGRLARRAEVQNAKVFLKNYNATTTHSSPAHPGGLVHLRPDPLPIDPDVMPPAQILEKIAAANKHYQSTPEGATFKLNGIITDLLTMAVADYPNDLLSATKHRVKVAELAVNAAITLRTFLAATKRPI